MGYHRFGLKPIHHLRSVCCRLEVQQGLHFGGDDQGAAAGARGRYHGADVRPAAHGQLRLQAQPGEARVRRVGLFRLLSVRRAGAQGSCRLRTVQSRMEAIPGSTAFTV